MPEPPIAPASKPFKKGVAGSGIVEALRENTALGVPQAGLVQKVHVNVWDAVKTGDPVLTLDGRELEALKLSQTAQVAVAQANLERLQGQLVRMEQVGDSGAIRAEDVKTRRSDVNVAQAQLLSSLAAVKQTETLLERLCVRSPIDGTVLQVSVRAGEYVVPSVSTPPVVLGNIHELQVRADVDEQIASRVQKGRKAVGYLKGDTKHPIAMDFVRIEPLVVPKRSLTGASTERVDTRVLQVIFKFTNTGTQAIYVGQQLDLFIEE